MQSPPPIQCDAVVVRQKELAPEVFWLVFEVDGKFPQPIPGQFVLLRVADGLDPLLRRPMSIFGFRDAGECSEVELLYRVVGRGTDLLARKRPGDRISLIGPLGRGFHVDSAPSRLLIAGGMGIAPLAFLASAPGLGSNDVLALGCRSVSAFPVDFIAERVRISFEVATEDGSRGAEGLVSELAASLAAERDWDVLLMAAGPPAMLGAVGKLSADRGVRCQVSMEARMACGVGSCLGCVVPARGTEGYRCVCRDGPVFFLEEIRWEALP